MKGESAPPWLELLLATQFFTTCTSHLLSSRNECNLFCIECQPPSPAFCYYCRSRHHSSHRVIQIRRSSYHDVVRVAELEDILDISDVQTYVINSARVVFLNERPQVRGCGAPPAVKASSSSSSSYNCETCSRVLLDTFRFCSLGCNLRGYKKDNMETTVVDGNGLDCSGKDGETGGSNGSANTGSGKENCSDAECCKERLPSTRVVRCHRRKGIPHRSPFF